MNRERDMVCPHYSSCPVAMEYGRKSQDEHEEFVIIKNGQGMYRCRACISQSPDAKCAFTEQLNLLVELVNKR